MKRFRLDILSQRDRACFHADFLAASDEAAARQAVRLFPERLLELWDGNRCVGRLGLEHARPPISRAGRL